MKKAIIALSAVSLMLVIPVAIKLSRTNESKQVEVEKVRLQSISPTVLTSGSLVYEGQVTLVPEIMARVDEIFTNEGDLIKRGQLLLKLDAEAHKLEVARLTASYQQSQLTFKRLQVSAKTHEDKLKKYKTLRSQGMIELVKFDELEAQFNMANIELASAEFAIKQVRASLNQSQDVLKKTEVRSPVDGKILSLNIKAGEVAIPSVANIPGAVLMVVADTTKLNAEVNIDEADIGKIALGQTAKIVPAGYPDRSLSGVVSKIATMTKQTVGQSKTYLVKVELKTKDAEYVRSGMSCRVEIQTLTGASKKSLAIPIQSVKYDDVDPILKKQKPYILVMKQDKAVRRDVEVGLADDSFIEIKKGITLEDVVVTGPYKTLRFLRDGDPIERIEEKFQKQNSGKN